MTATVEIACFLNASYVSVHPRHFCGCGAVYLAFAASLARGLLPVASDAQDFTPTTAPRAACTDANRGVHGVKATAAHNHLLWQVVTPNLPETEDFQLLESVALYV
jgi:hypothetical protein